MANALQVGMPGLAMGAIAIERLAQRRLGLLPIQLYLPAVGSISRTEF